MRYFKLPRPMRADQIALETLGGVERTQDLIRFNSGMSKTPILPEGAVVKIPEREEKNPEGVHLW